MNARFVTAGLVLAGLCFTTPSYAAGAEVKLLNAGKGPKRKLRFTPKKGAVSIVQMRMAMKMSMEMGGMKMPATEAPTTIITMKSRVEDVKANGNIVYAFEFTDVKLDGSAGMPPAAVEQMRAATKELVGTKGRGTLTPTGHNMGAKFDLPPNMSASARQALDGMRNSIEQIASPLPKEAVGVGASWRVVFTTDQMGIAIKQDTVYTLASMKGPKLDVRAKLSQSAASKTAKLPNLPPGMEARLLSLNSSGNASMELNLGRVMPVAGQTNVDMTMKTEMSAQGQTQQMTMGMQMNVALESK